MIPRGSGAARRGGGAGAGRGEHCEENPELSLKAATAGIHYPSGDMFIASVSHCWAPRWEQPTVGAASNSEGVRAAHPALHNGSSQAANPPGHHATALDFGADPVLFWAASGHMFSLGCLISHSRSDARALPPLPCDQPRQCPSTPAHAHPCPCPAVKSASSRGYCPVTIRSGAASFVPGSACCPDAAGVSIPSRSSPKAEMQPGSQEMPALAAWTSTP